MAGTVSLSAALSFLSALTGGALVGLSKPNLPVVSSAGNYQQGNQLIPTTAGGTALNLGAVATPGWLFIQNMDAANYVTILNATSGSSCVKLLPGEFALFRCASATPALLANTAGVEVQYILCDT